MSPRGLVQTLAPALWPWENHSISLSLCYLSCKETLIIPTPQGCCKKNSNNSINNNRHRKGDSSWPHSSGETDQIPGQIPVFPPHRPPSASTPESPSAITWDCKPITVSLCNSFHSLFVDSSCLLRQEGLKFGQGEICE